MTDMLNIAALQGFACGLQKIAIAERHWFNTRLERESALTKKLQAVERELARIKAELSNKDKLYQALQKVHQKLDSSHRKLNEEANEVRKALQVVAAAIPDERVLAILHGARDSRARPTGDSRAKPAATAHSDSSEPFSGPDTANPAQNGQQGNETRKRSEPEKPDTVRAGC